MALHVVGAFVYTYGRTMHSFVNCRCVRNDHMRRQCRVREHRTSRNLQMHFWIRRRCLRPSRRMSMWVFVPTCMQTTLWFASCFVVDWDDFFSVPHVCELSSDCTLTEVCKFRPDDIRDCHRECLVSFSMPLRKLFLAYMCLRFSNCRCLSGSALWRQCRVCCVQSRCFVRLHQGICWRSGCRLQA